MTIFHARKFLWRSICSLSSRQLHVCIVGSGPAGFYTAEKMLKAHKEADIDIIDRLPTPFGLVRTGVAPDHPETKIVINQFTRVATNERCSFFGNVSLGSSISLSELRNIYNVVVLAYGAESDRSLGIPGEDLLGIHSAREFVWWYNGHPDCNKLAPDLRSTDTAVVLGQGNVALDIARILLRPTEQLAATDIAEHALVSLQESSIRKVYLVGRRGPVQVACTAKELREILGIKGLHVHVKEADLLKTPRDEEGFKKNRTKKRVYELLFNAATSPRSHPCPGQRDLHFVFFRRPERFLHVDGSNRVNGVQFEKTCLQEDDSSGKQYAVGTGQFEELKCGLVLKSIGYKSIPVDGLPFDNDKGVVPNTRGRVLSDTSDQAAIEKGLYVVGWLKRGPTGIIATNLYCAEETVTSISEDLKKGILASTSDTKPGRSGLLEALNRRNIRYVTFSGWEKIDLKEKNEGNQQKKPREKITSWEELQNVATG
ncbi:NADPH:adrenodoxin oxidoreductase, mitochondrial [Aristolochia californica]|uniref:NADPH:adrenodoxin oxidoreductase, mitochondrial n=1 Tax=Aristolochia californica TaxID=171875 RepID=UPI0035E13E19